MNTENGNGLDPVALSCEAIRLTASIALSPRWTQSTGRPASLLADGVSSRAGEEASNGCARDWSTYRWWVNPLSQYLNAGPPEPVRPPSDLAQTPSPTTPSKTRPPITSTGASRVNSYPGLLAPPGASGAGALAHWPARMEEMA